MQWYYVLDGDKVGPISEDEMHDLIGDGKIGPKTLVWHEGMAQWQQLSEVHIEKSAVMEMAQGPKTEVCSGCGKSVPSEDMIRYGGRWVCANCKPVLAQRLMEGAMVWHAVRYAGFWIRLGAKLIDGIILGIMSLIPVPLIGLFLDPSEQYAPGAAALSFLTAYQIVITTVQVAIGAGFTTFFLGRFGATPGKMALRLKVVTADGGKITYGRALGRYFAELVSGFTMSIGYIMAAFTREKRALHDMICSTRVVRS
ncbi:MAG: RDD family protein [Pseudomonadota bacterium]